MSTEEQNRTKAEAEIILPNAALQAALAAAEGINARPVEDIPTGYEPVVAEGVKDHAGFAEAALDLINNDGSFKWAKPPASTTLTLVSNRDDEMEALEMRKQSAISALKDAIAKAEGGERDELEQALERLESAKKPGEIQAALTFAQSTLSREAAGGSSKAAGGNDPQERLDRVWEKIGELNKKIDTNFQKLDRYLSDEERATQKALKEEVEKRKAELERLKNSGASAEDILRAQKSLYDAEKRRTEYDKTITDRIRNDPNTSPEDKKTADETARLLEQKLKELEEAQRQFMEANDRAMAREGKSAEERERRRRQLQEQFNERNAALVQGGNVQDAQREMVRRRDDTTALQGEMLRAEALRSSAEPPTPGQNASAANGQAGAVQTEAAPRPAGDVATAGNSPDPGAGILSGAPSVSDPTNASLAENQTPARTPVVTVAANQQRRGPSPT